MLQVQTLATLKDWEALEALAKEKKNVLPIPVYIAAAKTNGAPKEATARYLHLPEHRNLTLAMGVHLCNTPYYMLC